MLADSSKNLMRFLTEAMLDISDYRIDPIKFSDILNDYGCSCGEYALEPKALERFEQGAKALNVKYTIEPYEDFFSEQPTLFVINIGYEM